MASKSQTSEYRVLLPLYSRPWAKPLRTGSDVQMYADTDKVFSGFIRGCQANPHACALARPNMTAQQVEASVYALLHDLKFNPIPFSGSLIDYSAAKSLIASAMYGPISWPGLAALINGVMVGNLSVLEDPALMPAANDVENEALQGIKCGDKFVHATTRADIQPALDKLSAESKILGDQLPMVINQCAQWTMPAKERYSGDFRVKTNSPVLVISNTYDPYTPLKSGRNLTADLEGSALLQQRGYGVSLILFSSSSSSLYLAFSSTSSPLPPSLHSYSVFESHRNADTEIPWAI